MTEPKNYWNDPDPLKFSGNYACPSCRVSFHINGFAYPHGLRRVNYCPVCGARCLNAIS